MTAEADDKFEMVAAAICWAEFTHPDPAVQGITPEKYWEKCSDQSKRHFRKLALAAILELRMPHDGMDRVAGEIIGFALDSTSEPEALAARARRASMDSIIPADPTLTPFPWPPDAVSLRWPDPDSPPKWEQG